MKIYQIIYQDDRNDIMFRGDNIEIKDNNAVFIKGYDNTVRGVFNLDGIERIVVVVEES